MNFCSQCGERVVRETPPGDHLPRYVCRACGTIHYQNPKIVVGCVPEHEGRILICRRAIEPRLGYWTMPAGFMENGETLQQGAARECQEEALAQVEIGSLLAVANVLSARQVHVFFRARLPEPALRRRAGKPGSRSWSSLPTFRGRTSPSPARSSPCSATWRTATAGIERHHFADARAARYNCG